MGRKLNLRTWMRSRSVSRHADRLRTFSSFLAHQIRHGALPGDGLLCAESVSSWQHSIPYPCATLTIYYN